MLLHLQKMQLINFSDILIDGIKEFKLMYDLNWEAKLNDQDIFNALFSMYPQYMHILPCHWNIQIHARINSLIYCNQNIPGRKLFQSTMIDSSAYDYEFFNQYERKISQVPLNCKESVKNNIFVCTQPAKILHFMAQTYRHYNFLDFYPNLWDNYSKMQWNSISGVK